MFEQEQLIGKHKGRARVCLWNQKMIDFGFSIHQKVEIVVEEKIVNIFPSEHGKRKVSGVRNHGKRLPVLDLKQNRKLDLRILGQVGDKVVVRFEPNLISIRSKNRIEETSGNEISPKDSIPTAGELSAICDQIDLLTSTIQDLRKPSDKYKKRAFKKGWNDSGRPGRADYSDARLKKITWQNLGYRLGKELGGKSGSWIDSVFDHVTEVWKSRYYSPTIYLDELDESVAELRKHFPIGLPPKGNHKPSKVDSPSQVYERDPQVKRWVLDNAEGYCELCGELSPFKSKVKGNPWYLEVHHVIPLKDNGPDTICNTVALCPNCHTRCHQSIDAPVATEELYEKNARLHVSQ